VTPDEARAVLRAGPDASPDEVSSSYRARREDLVASGAPAEDVHLLDTAEFWFEYHTRRTIEYAVTVQLLHAEQTVTYRPAVPVGDVSSLAKPAWAVLVPGWVHEDSEWAMQSVESLRGHLDALRLRHLSAVVQVRGFALPAVAVSYDAEGEAALPELCRKHVQGPTVLLWDRFLQVRPSTGLPLPTTAADVETEVPMRDPFKLWSAERQLAQQRERDKAEKKRLRAQAVRERKQADAALHQQHQAAGWPADWKPGLVLDWQAAGGTVESAQQLSTSGWTAAECKRAATALAPSGEVPAGVLEASAGLQRRLGNDLRGLCELQWPTVPAGTRVSVKRQRPGGERVRVSLFADAAGGFGALRATLRDGSWVSEEWRLAASSMADALAEQPDLLRFDLGTMAWIGVAEEEDIPLTHAAVELAWSGGAGESADEEDGFWSDDDPLEDWVKDDELVGEVVELDVRPRWVALNGLRVLAFPVREGELAPLLFRSSAEEFVPLRTVAESSWFSESGGAPISWDGGSELALLTDDVLMERTWGDIDPGLEVFPVDATDVDSLAEAVASWTINHDFEAAAALALEDLDKAGILNEASRKRWEDLLDSIQMGYCVEDESVTSRVRQLLTQRSPLYAKTATALHHPTRLRGRQLLAALEDVHGEGVLGSVTSGVWAE